MDKRFNIGVPIPRVEGTPLPPTITIEFPELTEKDLEEVYSLYLRILRIANTFLSIDGELPGFEAYTGIGKNIGGGNIYENSMGTLMELAYALAMTRHPLVRAILEPGFDPSKFNAKILVDNKIMAGMKILDLGSGPEPVFARCCRAMGADTWTVDIKPLSLDYDKSLFDEKKQDLERKRHIQIDLKDKKAVEIIEQKSGGKFHFVAEAFLTAINFPWGSKGSEIALPLLKKGGVHVRLPIISKNHGEIKK